MPRLSRCTILLALVPALAFSQAPQVAPPPAAPPAEAPPEVPPPPDDVGAQPAPAPAPQPAAAPAGQWVYTAQYGWLWMPYGAQYTHVSADLQVFPDEYVYYPAYGWRWVVAPWVYGYGPSPRWGPGGPRLFIWYSRPWFRVGGYWGWGGYRGWGAYRGWIGPRRWGPHGWAGAPPYYRTGVGAPHRDHDLRPHPARPAQRERMREHHERRR